MLRMDQVHVIRHKLHVEKKSQRQVALELGLSRNTVRKYADTATPVRASSRSRARPVLERIGPLVDELLSEWSGATTRKQRITASAVHAALVARGEQVGLTTVRTYMRELRRSQREAFIPLVWSPGDAAQFDFFEVTVRVQAQQRKVWMFVMRMVYSGHDFVALYEHCDQLSFLDGHVRAFEYFGAVPNRVIYDNLSPAVKRVLRERVLTARFDALVKHYLFEPCFARPGEGHDKGSVEARGRGIRNALMVPVPSGDTLQEVSDALFDRVVEQGIGSLDPDHAPPLCRARNDNEPLGSLLTNVRVNSLPGFGPALEVSDSHGVYLRNVSAGGFKDGLLLGGNDVAPLCHQSGSGRLRTDPDAVRRLFTPLADQGRPAAFTASTEVLNREALAHRENLPGSARWPAARFGVVGLCDALPCPVLNFRISGGEFEGVGRNSLTIGHARRGVVRGTHITNAGTALRVRPLFYSSPALGLDLEPSEGNQAVRLSDSYGRRARLVSGDVNFVNNRITENFGGALSLNSKIGISESVTFLENTFVTADRDLTGRFKDFLNTSTWNADFVCNRFVLGNGRNMRFWLDGGSGVFMGNRVAGTGDITFGGNATGCKGELGVSSPPANFPTNEQQCDNMVGGTSDAFGASGPSPYARCEHVAYCGWQNSDIERPPVVRDPSVPDDPLTEDVDESLYIGAADILSPRTDVPWIVDPTGASGQPLPLDHTLFRIVSNNYFVMSPEQQSATEWEGDSILGFVDRFENNTVCMRAPDAGTTAMSLELRAPMIDGTGHNTQFVDTFEGEECVTTGVEVVVPTDVNIPEFTVGECSDDMRRFLACNCGQKDSVPLTATEVDVAGSRNAALEALCTDSDSGEVATSTWLQFEASVSPFLSTAEYLAESLDACVAPWEPRTTLQCWEDVEEMRWRSLVPEQQLNEARDRWRGVARSSALWGFPASRYPSLDSAETSVLRTWVDRVEEQGE